MSVAKILNGVIFSSILILAGCASAPPAPSSFPLNVGTEKTFKYKSVDEDGNKVEGSIATAIVQQIYGKSQYARVSQKPVAGVSGIYDVSGIQVTNTSTQVKIEYINGQLDKLSPHYTRSSAIFDFRIQPETDWVTVKVVAPQKIDTVKETNFIGLSASQLLSNEKMEKDIRNIFDKMDPGIDRMKFFKSEINVNYPVSSIISNFKRKCGNSFSELYETGEYKDGFACTVEDIKVKLAVFPYKTGSKILYEFKVFYTLNSKGESSYKNELAKKIIDNLVKIAND